MNACAYAGNKGAVHLFLLSIHLGQKKKYVLAWKTQRDCMGYKSSAALDQLKANRTHADAVYFIHFFLLTLPSQNAEEKSNSCDLCQMIKREDFNQHESAVSSIKTGILTLT